MNDITERGYWARYQAVYQDIVRQTSTPHAPWFVVPADHKWFARVVIGSVIVSALDGLNLRFPRVDKASLEEFAKVREALEQEGGRGARKPAKGKQANNKQANNEQARKQTKDRRAKGEQLESAAK